MFPPIPNSRPEPEWQRRLYAAHGALALRTLLRDGQHKMVEQYLRTGTLYARGGRGAGKSYTLAYLAALELRAGYTVLYRTGLNHAGDKFGRQQMLDTLKAIIGKQAAADAANSRRIWFVAGYYDFPPGREVAADLRDEPWLGGYFHKISALRSAWVGGLPEGTIEIEPGHDDDAATGVRPPVRLVQGPFGPARPARSDDDPVPFIVGGGS